MNELSGNPGELKPCKCGGKLELWHGSELVYTRCRQCNTRTDYDDIIDAVAENLTRPVEDALRAENETLYKQCEAEQMDAAIAEGRLESARHDSKNAARLIEALRAKNETLNGQIEAMRAVYEHPLVQVDDNGYVVSANGRSVFLSYEQALTLADQLAGELELEFMAPEATRLVRELRAQWASVPWALLYKCCEILGWEHTEDIAIELSAWITASEPEQEAASA